MADNLKLIKQDIDTYIDPNGAEGSILAEHHNAIEKSIVDKVGKYVGSAFTAVKTATIFTSGVFSWEENAMNNTENFTVKTSKKTSDLNDFGLLLETMATNDIIQFKDFVGRCVYLKFIGYTAGTDGSGNPIYNITVSGYAENPNYTYQINENEICILSISKEATDLTDYYTKEEIDAKTPKQYAKVVYVDSNNPETATIFDTENPPVTNDDSLKADDDNLYVGLNASNWVYKTSTGLYESEIVVSNLGSQIASASEKTTIHDNDKVGIADSQDSNKTKYWKWSTIKAYLLDYFRSQIEVGASTTMQESWKGKLIIFTANCTITVPSTLSSAYAFEAYTLTGVTVSWAITSPKTWENGTPTATPEKTTIAFFQRGSTNSVILLQ